MDSCGFHSVFENAIYKAFTKSKITQILTKKRESKITKTGITFETLGLPGWRTSMICNNHETERL